MKSKNLLILVVLLVLVVAGYSIKSTPRFSPLGSSTSTSTVVGQTDWIIYTNIKYRYTLKYPKDVFIQRVADTDPFSLEESASLEIGRRGTSDVGIRITAWEPYTYQTTNKIALEHNQIALLDLKSFSETLHQQFVDDKNPNFPNKKIGDLEEITFAGHKAYTATVTGYMDGYGSDTFRYVYIENENYKLVIQYSLKGDLSKQIIDTFKFTK